MLNGKAIQNLPPRKVTESGIGHIPQDRHKHGLVLDFSIEKIFPYKRIISVHIRSLA